MPPATDKNNTGPLKAEPSPSTASVNPIPKQKSRARVCVFCGSSSGTSPAHLSAAYSLAETLHKHDMDLVYGGGTVGLMGEVARTLVSLRGKDAVEGVIPSSVLSAERPNTNYDHRNAKDRILSRAYKHQGERKKGWWARRRYFGSGKTGHPALSEEALRQSKQIKMQINDKYGHVTITSDLAARKTRMVMAVATAGSGSGFVALSGGFGTMDEVMEVVTLYQHGVHKKRVAFFNVEGFWDNVGHWLEKAIEAGFVRPEMRDAVAVRNSAEGVLEWLEKGK